MQNCPICNSILHRHNDNYLVCRYCPHIISIYKNNSEIFNTICAADLYNQYRLFLNIENNSALLTNTYHYTIPTFTIKLSMNLDILKKILNNKKMFDCIILFLALD